MERIELAIPLHITTTRLGDAGMVVIFVFRAIILIRLSSCVISVMALCDMISVSRVGMLMLAILLQLDTSRSLKLLYIDGMDESLVLEALIISRVDG